MEGHKYGLNGCVFARAHVCEKLSVISQSAASTLTRPGATDLLQPPFVSFRSFRERDVIRIRSGSLNCISVQTHRGAGERGMKQRQRAAAPPQAAALPSVFRLFYRTCVNEERGCWDSLNGHDSVKHGESAGS